VSVRVWGATVAEKVHNLVYSFLVGGEVIPEHGGIFQVRLWVSLLCVDNCEPRLLASFNIFEPNGLQRNRERTERELRRIAEEENRSVIVNPIPIAFISVEFDGETSWITSCIRRTLLTTDRRESRNTWSLFANIAQHINGGNIADIMCNLEFCGYLY